MIKYARFSLWIFVILLIGWIFVPHHDFFEYDLAIELKLIQYITVVVLKTLLTTFLIILLAIILIIFNRNILKYVIIIWKTYNKLIISLPVFLLLIFIFIIPHEQYFIFKPSIDTKFAAGFTEENFNSIRIGMYKNEVIKILGKPLKFDTVGVPHYLHPSTEYYMSYTSDGACKWGDFAWLNYKICLNETLSVTKKVRGICYD